MLLTIDLPDNLPLTEADVRIELAIALDRQHSLRLDKAAQLAFDDCKTPMRKSCLC